jgi:proline dehydrogenase
MNFLYPLAKRFIAGRDLDSAKPRIQKLIDEGYEVSIDYIGEGSKTYTEARRAYKQYKEIINEFKDSNIDISIKPSQLGLSIHPYLSYMFLHSLAKCAAKCGHTIRLDMEDSSVTDLTRNLAISLHKRHGNVGVAMQANLYRTKRDLEILIDKNVSVRLVKGAYQESARIARVFDEHIRASFFDYAAHLYSSKSSKPAIATHDEGLIKDIQELIPNPDYFDYEFLYGVRRDVQKRLKSEGKRVRIYIPFGTDWLPYCLRRLKEFKNLKFLIKNIIKEWIK